MPRIALLVWLFLPTVLSSLFSKEIQDGCGERAGEFVCIIREELEGERGTKMVLTGQNARNYYPELCDIHVQIKQYNTSSYKIRSLTSSNKFKVVQDQTSFGCEKMADGKLKLTTDAEHIKLQLIPTKKSNAKTGGMSCEFYVTNTKDEEVFPEKDMTIEYVDKQGKEEVLQLEQYVLGGMKKQFNLLKYTCDPHSIHRDSAKLDGQVYSILPIVASDHGGDCKSHKGYNMAFVNSEGVIVEADTIHCEEVEGKWQYTIKPKGKGKGQNIPAPTEFQAACRMKTCMLCKDASKVKCVGSDCTPPKFHQDSDCNRLRCDTQFVEVDGGGRTKGNFECRPNEVDDKPGDWIFKKNDDEDEGKPFTNATCYNEMDCATHSPLACGVEKTEKSDCPKADSTQELKCPEGFKLELSSPTGNIKTSNVTCDTDTGFYRYAEEGSDGKTRVEDNFQVACARTEKEVAGAGFQFWYIIVIFVVVLIVIGLIVLCLFCMRRSKKADEQKRALLKKNDSAPSSTDSAKPPAGTGQTGLVHMQPCSTARQISSEQISEATAVEKTKKELVEKTVIEPTIDLKTAYSTDKERSRQTKSKKEAGSNEAEYIDDAKHSQQEKHSQVEQRNIPDMDDNAPSSKASHASKKEKKEESNLQPRKFDLNEKEKQIAKGKWRKNEDYPTMADIESDWDDAKDGKHTSKQRTGSKETIATKDIPTADTPSQRAAKGADLCEKTAEMERLLDTPALKLQRASSDERPAGSRGSYSQVSVRKTSNRITTLMTSLDVTQDQQK